MGVTNPQIDPKTVPALGVSFAGSYVGSFPQVEPTDLVSLAPCSWKHSNQSVIVSPKPKTYHCPKRLVCSDLGAQFAANLSL